MSQIEVCIRNVLAETHERLFINIVKTEAMNPTARPLGKSVGSRLRRGFLGVGCFGTRRFFCSHCRSLCWKIQPVDNRKHLEISGPFTGLWVLTARALRKAGYKSRRKVRADVQAGALHPFISIHDYGRYADAEVRKWLGLKSWRECWGNEPRIVRH